MSNGLNGSIQRFGMGWLVAALFVAAGLGCVVLTSQRVAWFHDVDADELRVLLFNDGIHDSGGTLLGDGHEQIAHAQERRSFLIPGLPFGPHLGKLEQELAEATPGTLQAAWRDVLPGLRVEVLGHYREPDGRLGVAQLVVIPELSAFLELANRSIDQALLTGTLEDEWKELPRTASRLRYAARGGHRWIRVEGQTLVVTLPVDPREWILLKVRGLVQGLDGVLDALLVEPDHERAKLTAMLGTLARAPLSFSEDEAGLTIRLGPGDVPGWLSVPHEHDYDSGLEQDVLAASPRDLDAALADVLLHGIEPDAALADVLAWGPPADTLRALLGAVQEEAGGRARRARDRLSLWVAQWNAEVGLPAAPVPTDDAAWLDAVRSWYGELLSWPTVKLDEGEQGAR